MNTNVYIHVYIYIYTHIHTYVHSHACKCCVEAPGKQPRPARSLALGPGSVHLVLPGSAVIIKKSQ